MEGRYDLPTAGDTSQRSTAADVPSAVAAAPVAVMMDEVEEGGEEIVKVYIEPV